MKFLKVILASIVASFFISFSLSFINYTPESQQNPDTYYFSIWELFVIYMYYITPVLIVISIITFIIYRIMKQLPHRMKLLLSILIATTITATAILIIFNINQSETNDIYLIPEGYEGEVYVFYNVKDAPKVESEAGFEVHTINEQGYFVTSTEDMDYGTVTDRYYYVDKQGNRTPIHGSCVSLFGTGGYNTSTHPEMELNYTGFKLTRTGCGEEFMLESFEQEKKEGIISEIINEYY